MSNEPEEKKGMENSEAGVPPIQPTYSTEIDPQERRNELEELLKNGKIAENQIENVKAVLRDFDNKVERAPYYQDGKRLKNLDEYDPKKGALWFEEGSELFYVGVVGNPTPISCIGSTPIAAEMLRFKVLNDTSAGALSLRPADCFILSSSQH
ncbi:hypothetical protein TWF730_001829 [Orbilia blumenaviensis]|uniref:Uncharacterized protein n=1 Tax=Orbilia blumenaviensis TaxID=1796055 RepID=A0AAV9UFB1_9PEZI